MSGGGTIKRSIAALLLLLFTVSIAPKIFFHAAIAGHTDLPACTDGASSAHFHEEQPNCHFDDLVVSSPFFSTAEQLQLPVHSFYPSYSNSFTFNYFPSVYFRKEGRGPPLG